MARPRLRNLILVLGDQLDRRALGAAGLDPSQDAVWMAEVQEEAAHVWCHKLRIAYFFSAMRHFRDDLEEQGIRVDYHQLGADPGADVGRDLPAVLKQSVDKLRPARLLVTQPGDWRVLEALQDTADGLGLELQVLPDHHFFCDLQTFTQWAEGRKQLVMEHFYRWMRREHGVLLEEDDQPAGGAWNFDADNRRSFGREGPGQIRPPRRFRPDGITQAVLELVSRRFGDHPGNLEHFDLPVTTHQARLALRDFVRHRLPAFGTFEDAMWTDEPFLYHSRLSAPLNLKLLDPRACVKAAVKAWERGEAEINHVEGFVRQILGWREFVRGIYWRHMPDYEKGNALGCADRDVPRCFWDGETDMNCVKQCMDHVLDHAYAHHIERLMVLGLLCQLLGVHPLRFHQWHMAMYVDAIDWVSLPNALGMSQWGDGGLLATKPYCASGNYINRMSPFCRDCRYDPKSATGDGACPFTALYWDFLDRHETRLSDNRRMVMQLRNLQRKTVRDRDEIRRQAEVVKENLAGGRGRAPGSE